MCQLEEIGSHVASSNAHFADTFATIEEAEEAMHNLELRELMKIGTISKQKNPRSVAGQQLYRKANTVAITHKARCILAEMEEKGIPMVVQDFDHGTFTATISIAISKEKVVVSIDSTIKPLVNN